MFSGAPDYRHQTGCDLLDIREDIDMGFLSRFFRKSCDMETAQQLFATCLRAIEVDLYADLDKVYSSQMDREVAGTLAAQVVNFLKGEDIDEIARVSDEPLRSRIMAILPRFGKGQRSACKLTGRPARSSLRLFAWQTS
jgi:hypothetical protein